MQLGSWGMVSVLVLVVVGLSDSASATTLGDSHAAMASPTQIVGWPGADASEYPIAPFPERPSPFDAFTQPLYTSPVAPGTFASGLTHFSFSALREAIEVDGRLMQVYDYRTVSSVTGGYDGRDGTPWSGLSLQAIAMVSDRGARDSVSIPAPHPPASSVPEPATVTIMALGVALGLARARRNRV